MRRRDWERGSRRLAGTECPTSNFFYGKVFDSKIICFPQDFVVRVSLGLPFRI